MRIYWYQGGLHLEPETDNERSGLVKLGDALAAVGVGSLERLAGRDDAESSDEESVVAVEKF
jgi:hypothetical protein